MIYYRITATVFIKDVGRVWEGTLDDIAAPAIEEAIVAAKRKLVGETAKRGQLSTPVVRITKIEELREEAPSHASEPPVQAPQPVAEPAGSSRFPKPLSSSGHLINDRDWSIILRHLQFEVLPSLERSGVKILNIDPSRFDAYLLCDHNGRRFTLSANPNVVSLTASLNYLSSIQERAERILASPKHSVYASDIFRMAQIICGGKSQREVTELMTQVFKGKGIEVLPD